MKNVMLNIAWWSLTAILLSYIVTVTIVAVVFVWYTPVYSRMLNALDSMDLWRRNLPIFKQHFGVIQ
jgi:hypothetical protein